MEISNDALVIPKKKHKIKGLNVKGETHAPSSPDPSNLNAVLVERIQIQTHCLRVRRRQLDLSCVVPSERLGDIHEAVKSPLQAKVASGGQG